MVVSAFERGRVALVQSLRLPPCGLGGCGAPPSARVAFLRLGGALGLDLAELQARE
jgi:hypothetical protein